MEYKGNSNSFLEIKLFENWLNFDLVKRIGCFN